MYKERLNYRKIILTLVFTLILINFISSLGDLTSTATIIDSPKISQDGFTIELKDTIDVEWEKIDNSYTPVYKDVSKYDIVTDSKTGEVTKTLKGISNITFRVNKLDELNCISNPFYQECSGYKWDFSLFESKNTITNKEIKAVYQEKENIWIIELWEDFLKLFGKEFPNAELIGYDIIYYGTITDLDPSLIYTYTNATYGFYNQTQATVTGLRLFPNNLTGDYKSFVFYN
jgi:hypothetical protein